MGLVAVRRDQVEEWVLPVPLTCVGEAVVAVDCAGLAAGAGEAAADVVLDSGFPSRVEVLGDGPVGFFGAADFAVAVVGSAPVSVDATGLSLSGKLADGVAVVGVTGAGDVLVIDVDCVIGVLVIAPMPVAVPVEGDAVVSFGYFGDGDYPIFPFNLPLLFTDNPQNIQDAAAALSVSGVGLVDSVGGFADAEFGFEGSAGLTRKGTTPVFPFPFPIVFDDLPTNVIVGSALLSFDMDCGSAAAVFGDSAVPVEGGGTHIASAVLPWVFPVALMGAA